MPTSEEQAATAADRISSIIERSGPIGYDVFTAIALYDPDFGFYATGGAAGRRSADFITSPEVGPLFGAVVARRLDEHWRRLGEPAVFRVAEAGAGRGTLARTVMLAQPACRDALDYVLVEISDVLRRSHPVDCRSVSDLPAEVDAIMANELLDNVPFRIARYAEHGWVEVMIDVGDRATNTFIETTAPLDVLPVPATECLGRLRDDFHVPIGTEVPIATAAARWVDDAVARAPLVLVFDYTATTEDLAQRPPRSWLRTYAEHARGHTPLVAIGAQDITIDVPIDQLLAPDRVSTQAEWLRANGIDELVAEGAAVWQARAAIGDLEAVRARSRGREAEALLDPTGLGGFTVAEWTRPR